MWRPAERIRHKPSFGRVPTDGEAAASRLFSPVNIGALTRATHLGAGHGAVARHRRRLRHRRRARLVRALRARPPRRDRGRGDRHPRHPERARCCASATIASSRACSGWSRRCARRAPARRCFSSSSSIFSRSAAGRERTSSFSASSQITDAHRGRLAVPD